MEGKMYRMVWYALLITSLNLGLWRRGRVENHDGALLGEGERW
jgi:hypothetical protein